MKMKANLDRMSDGIAVLLIGEKDDEYEMNVNDLPIGAVEGDWLSVELDEEGTIVAMELDEEETSKAKSRITGKRAQLHQKASKFKK